MKEKKQTERKPHVIGLTGSMGAGKSTAARILRDYMPVLDLDEVNRHLLDRDQAGWQALRNLSWIPFLASGDIDRRQMASLMFENEDRRRQVEGILHPLLWKEMEKWIRSGQTCAVEVPLLFETGSQARFDEIWCVTCDQDLALERLQQFRGYSLREARSRLAHQFPARLKENRSDFVLYNNGPECELRRQIKERLELNG